MHQAVRGVAVATIVLLTVTACGPTGEPSPSAVSQEPAAMTPADRVQVSAESDARAIEIAQSVMERMGGWESWDATRFVRWNFFGRRTHYWDRQTDNVRMEIPTDEGAFVVLMNVGSRQGRVFKDGEELTEPEAVAEWLQNGHETWINDSYWMFMPYKLLDPGVTLRYSGERRTDDGATVDVLELTFAETAGYTPNNRYEVFVDRETGLVSAWSFFAEATDPQPQFTLPWQDWEQFGRIWLATGHGRDADWAIAVHAEMPESVFVDPASPEL